jgi:hypothetical protein
VFTGYASSDGSDSSMAMSRNSLASKISPHSSHSTNSESSSRETIRTRGCLQAWSISCSDDVAGGVELFNIGAAPVELSGAMAVDSVALAAGCQGEEILIALLTAMDGRAGMK